MDHEQPRPRDAEAGFSLIEVLVAFTVTGIVLAALLPALQTARTRVVASQERQQAVQFARAQMELLKLEPLATSGIVEGSEPPWVWHAEFRVEPAPPRTTVRLRTISLWVDRERMGRSVLNVQTRQMILVTVP